MNLSLSVKSIAICIIVIFLLVIKSFWVNINSKSIHESIDKTVKEAYTEEQSRKAVDVIRRLIVSLPDDNADHHEGELAIAKLLLRTGEEKESLAIYDSAIRNKWENAFTAYQNALMDVKRMDKAAVYEFLRLTNVEPYGYYRPEKYNYTWFNKILGLIKVHNLPGTCEDLVFKELKANEEYPQSLNIAKSFCLAYDGDADGAVQLLDQADQSLEKSNSPERSQWPYIPLYKMTILAKANQKRNRLDRAL